MVLYSQSRCMCSIAVETPPNKSQWQPKREMSWVETKAEPEVMIETELAANERGARTVGARCDPGARLPEVGVRLVSRVECLRAGLTAESILAQRGCIHARLTYEHMSDRRSTKCNIRGIQDGGLTEEKSDIGRNRHHEPISSSSNLVTRISNRSAAARRTQSSCDIREMSNTEAAHRNDAFYHARCHALTTP